MNKKIIILTVLFCFHLTLASAQLLVFRDVLEPDDENLKEQINKIKTVDNVLENYISELRDIADKQESTDSDRINLSAFLLKKIMLQRDLPISKNEDTLVEVSNLIPGNFYLESLWGDLFFTKEDFESCIPHYENALSVEPENIQIIAKCGIAYVRTLNYEKALDYIETFLNKYPEDYTFLYFAGYCKNELNEYDDAIDYWEKALEVAKTEKQRNDVEELIRKAKEALASTGDSSRDEDQRFIITFAGNSKDDLGDFAFDTLNEIYDEIASLIGCDPEVKFNVVFFLTEDYYNQNFNWSAASAKGIQIRIPLKTGYKSEEYVKGVLAHEFTHTMINLKTNNKAPIWVHEGLAQYQEYRTMYGSEDNLRSDFESVYQNDFKENDFFIPLDKIPAYMNSSNNRDVTRAYVASWLAIRCLKDLYSESSIDTLLTNLGKGFSIKESIKNTTGESYSDFQDELKQWIQNQ